MKYLRDFLIGALIGTPIAILVHCSDDSGYRDGTLGVPPHRFWGTE